MNPNLEHKSSFAAAVLLAGAVSAFSSSLSLVPTLDGDTSNEARAITADGRYVVGLSGSRGFLYPVGSASAINVLSSDNAQATIATGVGYRTSGGITELIIAGLSSGYVTEWMTSDGGATFGPKRRNTAFTSNVMPSANALGATTGLDTYYVTSWINGNGQSVYLGQGSGPWVATMNYSSKGITSTDSSRMNSVSASGRAVGWRINGGIRKNYMLTWNGTATPAAVYFKGLDGSEAGQAFAVSADGNTVFGQSPIVGDANNFGYKIVNPGASQYINPLPLFGDEAGSTSLQVPYGCTADGSFAVGMDYRGTERAVLWDTHKLDSSLWTITDLTDLASAEGILGGFSRLTRAYSVGQEPDGDLVIAGIGSWSPDGGVTPYTTRAFVMTVMIPEPTSLSLLVLGAAAVVASRRRK